MANVWKRLRRDPFALAGIAIIVLVTLSAFAAPVIAPFDPAEQFFDGLTLEGAPLAPGGNFLLGADHKFGVKVEDETWQ